MAKTEAERALQETIDEQARDIGRLEAHIRAAVGELEMLHKRLECRCASEALAATVGEIINGLKTQLDY